VKVDPNDYLFEPLGDHDRAAFSCSKKPLENYIREQASQDQKRNLAVVFVLVEKQTPRRVLGYYSLSNRELPLSTLPVELAKKAGRYNSLPVTLLGRMAVDDAQKGKGLGELVLMDAFKRSLQATEHVGSFAVFVEAKDEESASFYRKFGFIELPENRLKLFLPMKTIQKLFSGPPK
jgi:predicted GNAT family N-acyltransferase